MMGKPHPALSTSAAQSSLLSIAISMNLHIGLFLSRPFFTLSGARMGQCAYQPLL